MKNLFSSLFLLNVSGIFIWILMSSQAVLPGQVWNAPSYADSLRNHVPVTEATLKEGKKIYDNVCWTCHGLTGKGDGPAYAALNPKPADHTSAHTQNQSDGSLFWKISNGKGNMQPYGKIYTSKQRWELVNYIRVLGKNNSSKNSSY